MAKKKKSSGVSLQVIGGNCEQVTGSSTLVDTGDDMFLIEAGMIQNNHSPVETYHEISAEVESQEDNKDICIASALRPCRTSLQHI